MCCPEECQRSRSVTPGSNTYEKRKLPPKIVLILHHWLNTHFGHATYIVSTYQRTAWERSTLIEFQPEGQRCGFAAQEPDEWLKSDTALGRSSCIKDHSIAKRHQVAYYRFQDHKQPPHAFERLTLYAISQRLIAVMQAVKTRSCYKVRRVHRALYRSKLSVATTLSPECVVHLDS